MGKEKISYHYPSRQKTKDGWREASTIVGRVRRDGSIENTPYRFRRRRVVGGIAITQHKELVDLPSGDKMNPATGARFKRTKSGKGWWNKRDKVFVPNSYLEVEK